MSKWLDSGSADEREENSVKFYTKNKDGQYELFPKPFRFWKWLLPFVGALLVIGILVASAIGDEMQKNYDMFSANALLCDTEEQVIEFLTAVKGLPQGSTIPVVEGCGYLQFPVPAAWEYVSVYADETATATIIKAESPAFGVQYMYLEYVLKPPSSYV